MIYLELFWSFLQIGIFSFGGGYASLPLIQNQVVDLHGWLKINEFVDVITIAQVMPGSVAVNAATAIGTRVGGLPGSVVATVGCILPSCIILTVLSALYMKHKKLSLLQGTLAVLRPCAVGLIGSAAFTLLTISLFGAADITAFKALDITALVIFGFGLLLLKKFKKSPVVVMLISGLAGLLIYGIAP